MRSHRRRDPLEHVLVAGDETDLDAVRALLVCLPSTTYGQVVVETAADQELPPLATPARVTVTHLRRSPDASTYAVPGDLLADAVNAWLAEWIPDEPEPDRTFSIWVGACARNRVRAWSEHLETL